MEYRDAAKLLMEIEQKYDVQSIKYKGLSIWPYLRIYILDSIIAQPTEQQVSTANILMVLRSLFFYNPIELFKKHAVWVYTGTIIRKLVGNKYKQHVAGAVTEAFTDSLVWEQPEAARFHEKKENIDEKYIISNAWTVIISKLIYLLRKPFRVKILNHELLDRILEDYNLRFDYISHINNLYSQKLAVDVLLFLVPKPKLVFVICAYGRMGYLWSLHNHGIPVVELQHGVLNRGHFAYNSLFHSDVLYPDEICVYGEEEYNYFTLEQKNYCNKTTMTGLYLLDCSDKEFNKDIFYKYRKQYQKVVVLAGQTGYEELLMEYTEELAKRLPNYLFVYIPRRHVENVSLRQSNILFMEGVNIYEYLKWCDIHCTISSTTCLEAHYFRKPVVFYVTQNSVAKDYYGHILGNDNGAFYAQTVDDFVGFAAKVDSSTFKYRELFAHNSVDNMKQVIERYMR